MPVAHINDTELIYLEVGAGLPCLVMHGGLEGDHRCLHPWIDRSGILCGSFIMISDAMAAPVVHPWRH